MTTRILTQCAQLICITIEKNSGNILVLLLGMDDILRMDKLVKHKLGRLVDGVKLRGLQRLHVYLFGLRPVVRYGSSSMRR